MSKRKQATCPECGGLGQTTYSDGKREWNEDCLECDGLGYIWVTMRWDPIEPDKPEESLEM